MFWFYKGWIPEMIENGSGEWKTTGEMIEVKSPYTLEETLQRYKGWDTACPKYKPYEPEKSMADNNVILPFKVRKF